MMQEVADRSQIAARGYSDAELARVQAEREAQRRAQIDEAWATIERLDPRFAAAKQAEMQRMSQLEQMDATLARAAAIHSDGFMRRQIEAWHVREIARKSPGRQAGMEISR